MSKEKLCFYVSHLHMIEYRYCVVRRSKHSTCTQWMASTCHASWYTAPSLTWLCLGTILSSATSAVSSSSKSWMGISPLISMHYSLVVIGCRELMVMVKPTNRLQGGSSFRYAPGERKIIFSCTADRKEASSCEYFKLDYTTFLHHVKKNFLFFLYSAIVSAYECLTSACSNCSTRL